MLVDDTDEGEQAGVQVLIEHAITDGHEEPGGNRVVSRPFEFVDLRPDGQVANGGYAPYLDHRPPTEAEAAAVKELLEDPWLLSGVERAAVGHAVEVTVPTHLAEVRAQVVTRVAKVRAAVRERLTRQVAYWDARATELAEQADAGRQPRMNPDRARARADELGARLHTRLASLDCDERLAALPPVVTGAALIVPAGLLHRMKGDAAPAPPPFSLDRRTVEDRAVAAVVAAEEAVDRVVRVMARNNPGFDLAPEEHRNRIRR